MHGPACNKWIGPLPQGAEVQNSIDPGGTTFVQVGGAAVSSSHHRKGILYWTAVGAGIGGGIGFLTMMRDECRNPDSLCPLAPMMFSTMGAIVGLFAAPGN